MNAAHLRSRHISPPEPTLSPRIARRTRGLLLSIALVSAVAFLPHAHAQQNNNAAQDNGNQGAAGKNNANGAPAKKTAAQKAQQDSQRLLGGPGASLGGYDMTDASPDGQREMLLNSERMRVAKPNTQAAGGPGDGGGGGGRAAMKRPARGGAAAGGNADPAGGAGQGGNVAAAGGVGGAATAVYGSPYSTRAGQNLYKSPW